MTATIECANWFQREDELVQIKNKRGKTIILDELFSKIWLKIEYEIEVEDLIKKLEEDDISEDTVKKCLEQMVDKRLIGLYDKSDRFDMLFG